MVFICDLSRCYPTQADVEIHGKANSDVLRRIRVPFVVAALHVLVDLLIKILDGNSVHHFKV